MKTKKFKLLLVTLIIVIGTLVIYFPEVKHWAGGCQGHDCANDPCHPCCPDPPPGVCDEPCNPNTDPNCCVCLLNCSCV